MPQAYPMLMARVDRGLRSSHQIAYLLGTLARNAHASAGEIATPVLLLATAW